MTFEYFAQKHPGGGRDQNERSNQDRNQTLPVPPYLQRRPPLRKHLPTQRTLLLLPPHDPQASPTAELRPKGQFRPPPPRRPQRNPGLPRHHPPEDSLQRSRLQKSRTTPLRPPDRQPKPPQTAARSGSNRTSPRNHHRPGTRHPRPRIRNHRREKLHHPPPRTPHQPGHSPDAIPAQSSQPRAHRSAPTRTHLAPGTTP